jgi:hypothetical protein
MPNFGSSFGFGEAQDSAIFGFDSKEKAQQLPPPSRKIDAPSLALALALQKGDSAGSSNTARGNRRKQKQQQSVSQNSSSQTSTTSPSKGGSYFNQLRETATRAAKPVGSTFLEGGTDFMSGVKNALGNSPIPKSNKSKRSASARTSATTKQQRRKQKQQQSQQKQLKLIGLDDDSSDDEAVQKGGWKKTTTTRQQRTMDATNTSKRSTDSSKTTSSKRQKSVMHEESSDSDEITSYWLNPQSQSASATKEQELRKLRQLADSVLYDSDSDRPANSPLWERKDSETCDPDHADRTPFARADSRMNDAEYIPRPPHGLDVESTEVETHVKSIIDGLTLNHCNNAQQTAEATIMSILSPLRETTVKAGLMRSYLMGHQVGSGLKCPSFSDLQDSIFGPLGTLPLFQKTQQGPYLYTTDPEITMVTLKPTIKVLTSYHEELQFRVLSNEMVKELVGREFFNQGGFASRLSELKVHRKWPSLETVKERLLYEYNAWMEERGGRGVFTVKRRRQEKDEPPKPKKKKCSRPASSRIPRSNCDPAMMITTTMQQQQQFQQFQHRQFQIMAELAKTAASAVPVTPPPPQQGHSNELLEEVLDNSNRDQDIAEKEKKSIELEESPSKSKKLVKTVASTVPVTPPPPPQAHPNELLEELLDNRDQDIKEKEEKINELEESLKIERKSVLELEIERQSVLELDAQRKELSDNRDQDIAEKEEKINELEESLKIERQSVLELEIERQSSLEFDAQREELLEDKDQDIAEKGEKINELEESLKIERQSVLELDAQRKELEDTRHCLEEKNRSLRKHSQEQVEVTTKLQERLKIKQEDGEATDKLKIKQEDREGEATDKLEADNQFLRERLNRAQEQLRSKDQEREEMELLRADNRKLHQRLKAAKEQVRTSDQGGQEVEQLRAGNVDLRNRLRDAQEKFEQDRKMANIRKKRLEGEIESGKSREDSLQEEIDLLNEQSDRRQANYEDV